MKPRAPRNALAWLRTEPAFARLGEQASRLAAIQADLLAAMPGLAVTVIAMDRDTLTVGARHAAVAARVRQMEPSLVAALRRRGWKIDHIRFKPQWQGVPGGPARPDKPGLDERSAAEIAGLSRRVADPRLRAALERMARRHGAVPEDGPAE